MNLIDLHCHILPEVDDGASSLKDALQLGQAAVDQDITHILLTPHHLDKSYVNHKQDIVNKTQKFQESLHEKGIPLTVFPGQEVHLNGDLLQKIDVDDVIFMDESQRYLLLELPHNDFPEYTAKVIFDLQSRGIMPVIAHPERNRAFQKDPTKLYKLVEQGCLTQLTAGSYLGVFGKEVEKFTEKIIAANLGTIFASDAHNFKGRKFAMKEAFEKLSDKNSDTAQRFNRNAKNILNGDEVEFVEYHPSHEFKTNKKKFWIF